MSVKYSWNGKKRGRLIDMKKTVRVLALIFLMAALLVPLAAGAAEKPMTISFNGPVTLSPGKAAKALTTKFNAVTDGTVVYSLTDTVKRTVIYTETKTEITAGQEVKWVVPYYDEGMSSSKPIKALRASFVLDGKTYSYMLYYNFSPKDGGSVTVEKATWYSNNTACSFGPAFRDVKPGLTDKWYTFTPVDLTIQGRQTFEYVGSNKYVLGEVFVDVDGDQVTVNFHNFYEAQDGQTKTLEKFFTFFHDLDSVTDVEPETMADPGFTFGQVLSIENDLDGDTNVLLFVRNLVTYLDYVNYTHKLTRFWPNLPERVTLREQMLSLMD